MLTVTLKMMTRWHYNTATPALTYESTPVLAHAVLLHFRLPLWHKLQQTTYTMIIKYTPKLTRWNIHPCTCGHEGWTSHPIYKFLQNNNSLSITIVRGQCGISLLVTHGNAVQIIPYSLVHLLQTKYVLREKPPHTHLRL